MAASHWSAEADRFCWMAKLSRHIMIQKNYSLRRVIVGILCCYSVLSFAQYQAGDTIEIKTDTYEEQTIEAEWNSINESPIAGKNVPTEMEGRVVIANTKSGSLLGYPIYVGEGGGSFVINIDYLGRPGGQFAGYMNLFFDDGAEEKINMTTEGWAVATSQVYQLSPGFHMLYTRYKGSSQSFYIDKFRMKVMPGTIKQKPVRQLSALTYTPEIVEIEDYDVDKSSTVFNSTFLTFLTIFKPFILFIPPFHFFFHI